MSTRTLVRRLNAIACRENGAFVVFLDSLAPAESRQWLTGTLERLADAGIIAPVPANLWTLPQVEKDAYLMHLQERIPGTTGVTRIIRQEWCQWQAIKP